MSAGPFLRFPHSKKAFVVLVLTITAMRLSSVARCEGIRRRDPKGNLSLKTFTWAPQMFTWAPQTNFPFELLWGTTAMRQQENVCELTSKQMTVWCLSTTGVWWRKLRCYFGLDGCSDLGAWPRWKREVSKVCLLCTQFCLFVNFPQATLLRTFFSFTFHLNW